MSPGKAGGLLIPSIVTIAAFSVLVGLGLWQIERKAWKDALIATLDLRLSAPAIPLPAARNWAGLDAARDEFRRVSFAAEFLIDQQAFVYAAGSALRGDASGPGFWVFAPARVTGGGLIMVNRGFLPGTEPPKTAGVGKTTGVVNIVGVMRWPEADSMFSPKADIVRGLWFTRDHLSIAATKNLGPVAPFYIEQESPPAPGGLPRVGTIKVNLRNDHLGYALTWFGLAGVLVAVFAVWAANRRRSR